ncbi:hypothetical protein [Daejeonella oryzae]|uniref:hypothetical protein n=1 Tax=Daejeonella oryzae TaxID=1122943 RepID=UPI00040DBFC0|nr:hypothetical protein [Daejeonella oryzae]
MKFLYAITAAIFLSACSEQQKEFSDISAGMTQQEVILNAGEPSAKKELGQTELWTYKDADRTIVFRNDTVLNVLTSSEARIDSIEMSLQDVGEDIKTGAEKAAGKIDSLGNNLKKRISRDSLIN